MKSLLTNKQVKKTTSWQSTTGWSNGAPDGNTNVVLNAGYNTLTNGSFTCFHLNISSSVALVISTGTYIKVLGTAVTQAATATFTINNLGEFILLNKSVDVSSVKVTINRIIPGLQNLDYWMLSSPISGINLIKLSPATSTTRFYIYNEPTDDFRPVNPATTLTEAGRGWLIRKPPNSPVTVANWDLSINNLSGGSLNKGIIQVDVTHQNDGYTIISNPYTAKLSLRKFYEANKTVLSSIFFIWCKTNDSNSPSYFSLNKICSSRSNFDINIPPFQGFLLKALANATLVFTPDMQELHTDYTVPARFFVTLKKENVNLPIGSASYTVALFKENFTQFYNNSNSSSVIGFYLDSNSYSLKYDTSWSPDKRLLLKVYTYYAANYLISISAFSGLFDDYDILVEDTLLQVTHNLSNSDYLFAATATTVYDSRFYLLFLEK
jgi:hypothetical protein